MGRPDDAAMKPHKNDPGAYTITVYSPLGRKRGTATRTNRMKAEALARRWVRMTGGSATIHRCLWNSSLGRPSYPEAMQ